MSKESTQLKRHRGAKQERPLTPEEEEQCRRSRHSSRSTGVPSTSWRTGLYARRSKHVMEDRPVCKEVQA